MRMPSTPRLKISEADDPFAPIFLSVGELTERIKRLLENNFRRGRASRRGLKRHPTAIRAPLFHTQG
jgi:hypothetical protein